MSTKMKFRMIVITLFLSLNLFTIAHADLNWFWRKRRHSCTRWVNVRHNCTRLVTVKEPVYTWYWANPGYWKSVYWYTYTKYEWTGPWYARRLVASNVKVYRDVWVAPTNWTKKVSHYISVTKLKTFYNSINCGLQYAPHWQLKTYHDQTRCGYKGWPHEEYVFNTDPTFNLTYHLNRYYFNTPSRGLGYCWNGWWSWGFHGQNGNRWYGDYAASHAPGNWAYCFDMKSISFVVKTDSNNKKTIIKSKDLTKDLVKTYSIGARKIQLWMGDYGLWGTGAEICVYKLVPDSSYGDGKSTLGYYRDNCKMSDQHNNNWNTHYTHGCRTGWTEPGAYWTPDPAGSYMEFMLVDTINNRIVLSASKNVDGTAKTWWLNMWGFLHPRKIISKDLVMYFRVKDVWGSDWLKWDGKDINRVKYVFRTGSPFQY